MHSKEVVCLARKKREDGHQKDRHEFEAVEINGRIHVEDQLQAEKEEKAEKINWQEDWKKNEEDCDTAFDIWRKSYSKKSEGEM